MAYLRLHADDGENGRWRIQQLTSADCKSAQNQHAELYANVANEIARMGQGSKPLQGIEGDSVPSRLLRL